MTAITIWRNIVGQKWFIEYDRTELRDLIGQKLLILGEFNSRDKHRFIYNI